MRTRAIYFLILLNIFCSFIANAASSLPKGFVYLADIDPTISQDIGFARDDNCVGRKLDGYEGSQVICTKALAKELKQVQADLKKLNPNYSLQVLDAYRPVMASEHLKRWAADLNDQKTKAKCYPDIDKKELLGKFIAGKNSPHNRGSTVDVGIIDLSTGKLLDFGPDYFGEYSNINYSGLTKQQKENRQFLRKLMLSHNFKAYDAEFWHFILKDEPFPKTNFNFVILNK